MVRDKSNNKFPQVKQIFTLKRTRRRITKEFFCHMRCISPFLAACLTNFLCLSFQVCTCLPESVSPPLCSYLHPFLSASLRPPLPLHCCSPAPISKSIAMSVFNPTMTWVPHSAPPKYIPCLIDPHSSTHHHPITNHKLQTGSDTNGDYMRSATYPCPSLQRFLIPSASISAPYPWRFLTTSSFP